MRSIPQLLLKDRQRLRILKLLASINLKDAYIAAGFVRNMVWDELHQKVTPTALNDVDVVFFDDSEQDDGLAQNALQSLQILDSSVPWQVKNQAKMHINNHDRAYLNTQDAMSFWPEKETAIAVRLTSTQEIEVLAPFGTDSLYEGLISHNPKRSKAVFLQRVHSKGWLDTWPKLKIAMD